MDTAARRPRLILPLALVVAGVAGALAGAAFLVMPASLFEDVTVFTGLPAILDLLIPPVGLAGRLAMAVIAGGFTLGLGWLGLSVILGNRSVSLGTATGPAPEVGAPILRRADAHPDAPARRPLSALRDILEPTKVQPLPDDLDQPLSAFDPSAVPAEPMEPVRALPSLSRTYDEGERLEAFELPPFELDIGDAEPLEDFTPPFRKAAPRPAPVVETFEQPKPMPAPAPRAPVPAPANDVRALMERLERGVATLPPQAEPARAPESLENALAALRKLAVR